MKELLFRYSWIITVTIPAGVIGGYFAGARLCSWASPDRGEDFGNFFKILIAGWIGAFLGPFLLTYLSLVLIRYLRRRR